MIVSNLALLASNTTRTKAYIQTMIRADFLPEMCVVYAEDIESLRQETLRYEKRIQDVPYFDHEAPLLWTLENYGVAYQVLPYKDINSEEMLQCLRNLPQKYLIYSGYGGYILKKPLFQLGKKYIHVHAGILPQYRGSTTIYYSYLEHKQFGATAIFLSEGIDEGEMLYQKTFDIPEDDVNIDYIYEPYLRAQVLLEVVQKLAKEGQLQTMEQSSQDAETYFIIHPVLKHLALLGIEKQREDMK